MPEFREGDVTRVFNAVRKGPPPNYRTPDPHYNIEPPRGPSPAGPGGGGGGPDPEASSRLDELRGSLERSFNETARERESEDPGIGR